MQNYSAFLFLVSLVRENLRGLRRNLKLKNWALLTSIKWVRLWPLTSFSFPASMRHAPAQYFLLILVIRFFNTNCSRYTKDCDNVNRSRWHSMFELLTYFHEFLKNESTNLFSLLDISQLKKKTKYLIGQKMHFFSQF